MRAASTLRPLAPRDVLLVESLAADDDGARLAALLAASGHAVRTAPPGVGHDAPFDVLVADVWTPEVAAHVEAARAVGRRVLSIGELVLASAPVPVVGITGTAGKTSTSRHLLDLLGGGGVDAQAGDARLGNAWPDAALLARLGALRSPSIVVAELTSSHLAFMDASPQVAVVTAFWADHVELHGSLSRYREAKRRLVRRQPPDGWLVLDADAPGLAAFARASPARRAWFSCTRRVPRGAFLERGRLVLKWDDGDHVLGDRDAVADAHVGNVLAAIAAARACGVLPDAIAAGLGTLRPVAHRRHAVVDTAALRVIDDGMAATPAKGLATLATLPAGRVVLVAGGFDELGGGPVHASPEEQALLVDAARAAAARCRAAILFGPAAERLAPLLATAGLARIERVPDAAAATRRAIAVAAHGDTVVFAPMFPVSLEERQAFPDAARAAAAD